MAGNFTDIVDGDGDDYDREFALIEQAGRIKTRDTTFYGKSTKRQIAHQNCYATSPEYKKDQAARVEAHRRRVVAEEKFWAR